MKHNVTHLERTVRFGLGMLLLASPVLEQPTYPFNLLGIALVVSAFAAYCPAYGLLAALNPRSARQPAQLKA